MNRAARLMSIAHGGQVLLSSVCADLFREAPRPGIELRDLGEHRLRDLSRGEVVYQLVVVGLDEDFPALRSLDAFPSNLPAGLSSFVGRDAELASVAAALGEHRLVTVTGVGGVGKTRLATQVAADVLPRFADGAWFCELAGAGDPDSLVETVAATVGARPQAEASILDSVVEFLRGRSVLLVLDNCEHLLTPTGRFAAQVLSRCPKVRILATSREGLAVDGERVIPIGSLTVPEATDVASIAASEAVQLFAVRGAAVRDGFTVDDRNAVPVSEICTRLDGIPLAIELAAARLGGMSAFEIAGLLDERFRLLTGGRRLAVERHQTLRSTIDWSYELLTDRERAVFERLGVFVGSFDTAAAVSVVQDGVLERWDVLDALADLVAKSMLTAETTTEGVTRYQLLETLRQYARERLEEAGTTDHFRRHHVAHYAGWAEEAGGGLVSPRELVWRAALYAELDNLRVAVAWSIDSEEREDQEYALRIIAALSFEAGANRRSGIFRWADRALPLVSSAQPDLRLGVHGAAAWSAVMALDYERARELADFETTVEWSERVAGPVSWSALDAASITAALYTGRFEEAEGRITRLMERWADVPEPDGNWMAVMARATLAMSAHVQGQSERARSLSIEALEIAQRGGSPSALAMAHYTYGWTMMETDPDAALTGFDESVRLARSGASDMTLAHSLARAAVVRASSDPTHALVDLRDATAFAHDVGSVVTVMSVLDYGIRVAAALDLAWVGAVLVGFVQAGRSVVLNPVAGEEAAARRHAIDRVRADLGDEQFEQFTQQGAQLTYEELTAWLVEALDRLIDEREVS